MSAPKIPAYVMCGVCGHYHRPDYWGDCRNDDERFTAGQLDVIHPDGWLEVDEDGDAV